MVYNSDFYTTRRTYSRPTVTSYSVSYPIRVTTPVISKVYTSSYPIYSYSSTPYTVRSSISGTTRVRVISTPVRVVHSPTRYIRSSVTPIRDFTSPIRSIVSPVRSFVSPLRYFTTERVITSPVRTIVTSTRTRPSVLLKEYDRILNRPRPRVGYRPLEEYLNSDTFINFDDEARKIRSSAATLLREIHTPILRSTRSVTPFPIVSKYEPISPYALEAYVARIKNPLRHVVKEIHSMTNYPEPARKYPGKSHLASVRIVGNRAYNIRNPLYSPDKVRNDVEYLSRYLKNREAAKNRTEGKLVKPIDDKENIEQTV